MAKKKEPTKAPVKEDSRQAAMVEPSKPAVVAAKPAETKPAPTPAPAAKVAEKPAATAPTPAPAAKVAEKPAATAPTPAPAAKVAEKPAATAPTPAPAAKIAEKPAATAPTPAPAAKVAEKPAAPTPVPAAPISPAPVAKAPAKAAATKATKPAAAKTSKSPASGKASGPVTIIVAKYDIGLGNSLYIRGEGAGLSWDAGTLMENVGSDVWVWTTNQMVEGLIAFKFLINDEIWSAGDNMSASAGETTTLTPYFP